DLPPPRAQQERAFIGRLGGNRARHQATEEQGGGHRGKDADLHGREQYSVANFPVMRSPPGWSRQPLPWLGLCAAMLAAEWLRSPSQWWAGGILVTTLAAMVLGLRTGGRSRAILAGIGVVAGAAILAQRHVVRFEREWPRERESRLQTAFKGLSGELRAAFESTEQLAERAVRV